MSAMPTNRQQESIPEKDSALSADLEERFHKLVAAWKAESVFMSSAKDMAMLPSYQQIISMGRQAVPLILSELAREPDHWFWALGAITGANPVPESSCGNVKEMTEAWLVWGKQRGFVH